MVASMASLLFLLPTLLLFAPSSSSSSFSSPSSTFLCPLQSHLILTNLQSQCPLSLVPSLAIEVDGDFLDIALSSSDRNVYTAVLFYATWCPFSRQAQTTFDVLSSKFPQIRHLAVEKSSAMPSLFSRYGIRSQPSFLMVSETAKVRYYGSKDLDSLVQFYKKTTGYEPIEYISDYQPSSLVDSDKPLLQVMSTSNTKEILTREPYLLFSVLFLTLRAFMYFCPGMLSRIRALWVLYIPHLNLGTFGESSQLLGRVAHLIDVKRIWNKMRLCKTRNFHKGAKNARVWASSLASVSLGESSSARPPIGEL